MAEYYPPVPPVELGPIARYLASAVNGPGGANPVDGTLIDTWVPFEALVGSPNLTQALMTDRPMWTDGDGYGRPAVMLGVSGSMVSAFVPPSGASPRSIVMIGGEWLSTPQTALVRYGTNMPPVAGAFFSVETGLTGKFGWNLGASDRGEGITQASNSPHAVVVTYDGSTILIQADGAGPSSNGVTANTTPSQLVIGGTMTFGLYELRIYDRALSLPEITDILTYASVKYGTPNPK